MPLAKIIKNRRSYRALTPVKITDKLVEDLAETASLAPSCFNNQPWRYIFVYDPEQLKNLHQALAEGNKWMQKASMIIAVIGKAEDDCILKDGRKYYLFDIGMSTAFILLRLWDKGLLGHPIAGYNPVKAREVLEIPENFDVITLIGVGKHSKTMTPEMSDDQKKTEKSRPARKGLNMIMFKNKYEER